MVSALTRLFGSAHLDLAEDVVQEALSKALRQWPFRGVPDQPAAWLFRVARNGALDMLRRKSALRAREPDIVCLIEARLSQATETLFEREIADDQLRMIFTCCHPAIAADARIALTLNSPLIKWLFPALTPR